MRQDTEYVPKTTVIEISCGWWTEHSVRSFPRIALSSLVSATRAVAVRIAHRCRMDIVSMSYMTRENECVATVVYINNGVSLADIKRIMAPEIDNKPQAYWMILDIEQWQNSLNCVVSARGTDEEW